MKKCLAGCCLLMSLCVASSCTTKNNQRTDKVETTEESAFSGVHIVPEYARGFELSYRGGYVLLDIQDPQKVRLFIMRLSGEERNRPASPDRIL